MKKTLALIALLTLSLVCYGCSRDEATSPTNELPMYGGVPKSAQEKAADDAFIAEMEKLGSRETAVKKMLQYGQEFYRKSELNNSNKKI